MSTSEQQGADTLPSATAALAIRPQRILACVLCQQRKVKCDRKFPCSNCTKHAVQCVPATQTRRRRRRFPERDLLDRIRRYEGLMRQNNVKFDPMHGDTDQPHKDSPEDGDESDDGHEGHGDQAESSIGDTASPPTPSRPKTANTVKNIWDAMNHGFRDEEAYKPVHSDAAFNTTWDNTFPNDNLLFGSRDGSVELATFHPEPVHIFRLWQIYLDNVNPLLKITHTPTLQTRIIEAAGNLNAIKPELEALMFSIYSTAILSLAPDECEAKFGSSKDDLSTKFHFGCQQALLNSSFLRTSNRECLTALYLYLIAISPGTDPRSLCSMLGICIRIAERMGMHNEARLNRCNVLEAEMRRRLWWSLVVTDARMSGLSHHTTATLAPTWDCKIPLNVNDADLREEMKDVPPVHAKATEAIFAVVRAELGEFSRNSPYQLDFTNPTLKVLAKELPRGGSCVGLRETIEEQYLRHCDPEIPLHYLTIWMTRSHIAKGCLLDHWSRFFSPDERKATEKERQEAMGFALEFLEADTKVLSSPHNRKYRWLLRLYFPFPGYVQIVQELKRQPLGPQASKAWEIMADNYNARLEETSVWEKTPLVRYLNIILQAWEVLEKALQESNQPIVQPRIVNALKERLDDLSSTTSSQMGDMDQFNQVMDTNMNDFPASMPETFGNTGFEYGMGMGGASGYMVTDPNAFTGVPAQQPVSHMNPMAFASMYWGGFGGRRGW